MRALVLILAVMFTASLPAQSPVVDSSPMMTSEGAIYALNAYADGTLAVVSMEGHRSIVTVKNAGQATIGHDADPGPDRQILTTRWVDASGTTWKVSTPVPGVREATLRAAIERHDAAVDLLRRLHPPAPPPTPPS